MAGVGPPEILLVLLVLLLMFGAARLPSLARSIGQASKEFKTGLKEGEVVPSVTEPCPFCGSEVPQGAKFCPGCPKSSQEVIAAQRST